MKPQTKKSPGRRPRAVEPDCCTRKAILDAARSLFARQGLNGTSVREVADAAGVNNAMIYYHFTDKVELYRAVLADSFLAFDHVWEHPVFSSSASAREKIRIYVDELIQFQHSHKEFRRILSMEFASCGENITWLADNFFKLSYEKLARIMNDGIRNGELKKVDVSLAISALVGMVVHSFITEPVAEYVSGRKMDLSAQKFGTFVTDIFFNGLGEHA